jgi:hypothetical protein
VTEGRQTVERRANWSVAHVDATGEGLVLTVPIEGDPSPDWDDAFRRAVEASRHKAWRGHWGHVRHRPDQVCVEQVTEGSEDAVREFIDICVHEADERLRQEEADRREDEDALEQRRTEASHGHEPTLGTYRAAAERMTERFREQ